MNLRKRCIATDALVFIVSLLSATLACAAQIAGTVTHLSGPLLAKKADGTIKVLSQKSTVEEGDTLISEKNTYARIKFTDHSEITLRPNTQLKIENFSFEEGKQEKDSASFNLVKGGLRAVTGAIGKRSRERFGLNTPTATIGIRGTIFIAEYIPPPQPAATAESASASASMSAAASATYRFAGLAAASPDLFMPGQWTATDEPRTAAPLAVVPIRVAQISGSSFQQAQSRAPGLYVQVLDGMINLSNGGGSQNFGAGQFGFTPSFNQLPLILPSNPGMQFQPPPAFQTTTGPQGENPGGGQADAVDCEVR